MHLLIDVLVRNDFLLNLSRYSESVEKFTLITLKINKCCHFSTLLHCSFVVYSKSSQALHILSGVHITKWALMAELYSIKGLAKF